ncbi:hypothetical protein Pla123a_43090 [Posidoniimonas polymericola]|uniref:Prenyltransferase and squalene oxidase repeat protein n=1 Tax=Posidoniimonas polymericola TaxID=2528002 RepID=A0A5C5XYX8_9BACT|nr:hypothetical protein [Posidoniimonas polymericola]TWT67751.1 hypothetical protein Pla123a_43090 [Posidoniimonas polymericola]
MTIAPVMAWIGGGTLLPILLWGSLAVSTAALLVMMRTRWGQERPTHRYVMLSVIAHLLLICVATTIRFASLPAGDGPGPVKVRIVMRTPADDTPVTPLEKEPLPVEPTTQDAEVKPAPADPEPAPDASSEPATEPEPELPLERAPERPEPKQPTVIEPAQESPSRVAPEAVPLLPPELLQPAPAESEPVDPPTNEASPPLPQPTTPQTAEPPQPAPQQPAAQEMAPIAPPVPADQPPPTTQPVSLPPANTAFVSREGDERVRRILEEGGDAYTEDAVAAALAWLATAQSPDGRWDADRWSAGRERGAVLGHPRTGVGMNADAGMTGLSLLALMGAGQSHDQGPFANIIRDGLAYLIRSQAADGNLYGEATLYAQTYCHSMATFALAEALASTSDERLRPAVVRAVQFLERRQDPRGGGWRYRPGDSGDMSQLGWIVMALRSAELADVPIQAETWDGIERFVRSTQCGQHLGLAGYRPNSPPSHSMTAESLYCRQILGRPIPGTASAQALEYVSQQPPGRGQANYYSWYYGTLALHHHRRVSAGAENAWRDWNDALKRTLVNSQVSEGVNKGSWSPHSVWGGCGGRVYTTALATMCLEVYYRYDPDELVRDPWIAARQFPGALR